GGVRRRLVVAHREVPLRLGEPGPGGGRGVQRGTGAAGGGLAHGGFGGDRVAGVKRGELPIVLAALILVAQDGAGLAELLHPPLGRLPAGQVRVGGAALPEPQLLADLLVDLLPSSGTVHSHYLVVVVHGTALVRCPSQAFPQVSRLGNGTGPLPPRVRRSDRRVQPVVEQRVQLLIGDLLTQRNEVLSGGVAVPVFLGPGRQDLEERLIAHL